MILAYSFFVQYHTSVTDTLGFLGKHSTAGPFSMHSCRLNLCAEHARRIANQRPISGLTFKCVNTEKGLPPLPEALSCDASIDDAQLQARLASQPRISVELESPRQ